MFDDDLRRGVALESMVSAGCIISGSQVKRSLLFTKVHVDSFCTIEGAVILPEVTIGQHVRIRNAIIDRGCRIPEGSVIGYDHDQDRENGYRVTSKGIVLVTRGMLGQPEGYA